MICLKKNFIASLYFFLISLSGLSQSDWKLIKNSQDIQVYVRTNDSTKFKEYKATMVVKATLDKVLQTIMDADELKNWNYQTSKSYLVKKLSDTEQTIYMENDMPWPVQNRDVVTRMKVQHPTSNIIIIKLLPDSESVPEKDKIIRVKNFSGYWYLEQSSKGIIVIQQMQGDPGGSLPAFLFNLFLTNGPFSTFLGLNKALAE
ncbi:MAG: lipid-binding protein [Flavobacteriales bacterium CG_4_9_14_3_um_filter_40_17]|nr:MAG: lipid-binding protein [Flavobacteriales bacterium CG_4_9_14_3_um_filter_40_17]